MALVDDARRRVRLARLRRRLERGEATAIDPKRAIDATRAASTVLFLCHGNICRSPMAEHYLRARLETMDVADPSVASAGFVDVEGRPSPLNAVTVARAHGVELSGHRSTRVTRSMVEDADVVFLMDALNYHHFDREFGDASARVHFLGPLDPERPDAFEIDDPEGGDVERFSRAYGRVTRAVDGLVAGLAVDR